MSIFVKSIIFGTTPYIFPKEVPLNTKIIPCSSHNQETFRCDRKFGTMKETSLKKQRKTQLLFRPRNPRVQAREQVLNYTRGSHRGQIPTSSPPSLPSSSFQWKSALWVRSEAAVSDHSSASSFGLDSGMNLICLADSWQVSQDWTHGHITRGPFELRSQRESNDRILRTVWRGNWLARRGEKEAAERSSARGRERFSTKVK